MTLPGRTRSAAWRAVRQPGLVATLALALLICWFNWSPLVRADWSIIDDHEIINWIKTRPRLPIGELLPRLAETEVLHPETTRRFRPSYYTLRLTETATWGRHVRLWYGARLLAAAFFALVLGYFCHRLAGFWAAGGFLVFEFSRPYWSEVFGQLGPSETYGAAGVALMAMGVWRLVQGRRSPGWAIAMTAGALVAIGCKESFLPLALVPAGLLCWRWRDLSALARGLCGAVLLFAGWVALTVAGVMLQTGKDVYQQSVTLDSRLSILKTLAESPYLQAMCVLLAVCLVLAAMLRLAAPGNPPAGQVATGLQAVAWWLLAAIALFFMQFVFYNGRWPTEETPRYNFPGVFAVHLAVFGAAAMLLRTVRAGLQASAAGLALLAAPLLALVYLVAAVPELATNRRIATGVVENGKRFADVREAARIFLGSHPGAPLLITSHSVGDYEAVFSMIRFMRAWGIVNPIAIELDGYASSQFEPGSLSHSLSETLEGFSRAGWAENDVIALAAMPPGPTCLIISLSMMPSRRCDYGMMAWPQPSYRLPRSEPLSDR